MPITDMPNVPPLDTPAIIAQASQAQAATVNRTVGVCRTLSNPPSQNTVTAQNTLTPARDVMDYLRGLEKRTVSGASRVTVLEPPKHGTLEDLGTVAFNEPMHSVRDTGVESYNYIPDSGYLGADHATLLVSIGNYQVRTEYVFQMTAQVNPNRNELCPKPYWKVSSAPGISSPIAAVADPASGYAVAPAISKD